MYLFEKINYYRTINLLVIYYRLFSLKNKKDVGDQKGLWKDNLLWEISEAYLMPIRYKEWVDKEIGKLVFELEFYRLPDGGEPAKTIHLTFKKQSNIFMLLIN